MSDTPEWGETKKLWLFNRDEGVIPVCGKEVLGAGRRAGTFWVPRVGGWRHLGLNAWATEAEALVEALALVEKRCNEWHDRLRKLKARQRVLEEAEA